MCNDRSTRLTDRQTRAVHRYPVAAVLGNLGRRFRRHDRRTVRILVVPSRTFFLLNKVETPAMRPRLCHFPDR
jgi:hypothetical protein